MKHFTLGILCLLLTCCEVKVETTPIATEIIYVEDCAGEPYWFGPEWCDYYSDGSVCCVWYSDGWYDEWCQWRYDMCWEYQSSW